MYNECLSPSLKNRIKSSMCCFGASHSKLEALDIEYEDLKHQRTPRSPILPYAWLKSSSSQELDVHKDKRRSIFSKIGSKNRKRPNSGDFRYDPLSYSLNFQDEMIRDNEYHVNFSARLPASPDRSQEAPIVSREIIACS